MGDAFKQDRPIGVPRIVPAGEDLSTLVNDHTTSVRDVRTPPQLLPVGQILAHQLGIQHVDRLRMIQGTIAELGSVSLWEVLDAAGNTEGHYVASYVVGADRLQLAYARKLEDALRRHDAIVLAHSIHAGRDHGPASVR